MMTQTSEGTGAPTSGSGSVLTIILNYRTPEMTLECAAAALSEMEDVPGEIVIVENGSGDTSWEVLQAGIAARGWEHARLRLVRSPINGGFGAGMNIGFSQQLSDGQKPDFYYLLNSDAFVKDGAISALRDFLRNSPGAGLAGSAVFGTDDVPHRTAFRFPSVAGEFEMGARTGVFSRLLSHAIVAMELPNHEQQVDWTAGASLMIRRDVIEETGGFDEQFFLYFEETDLCRRAAQAGWRTHFVPQSHVTHIGSASTGMKTLDRTPAYWFQSYMHYFTKSHGRAYALMAVLARLAGNGIYGLRRLVQGKPRADARCFSRDLFRHALKAQISPHPNSKEMRAPKTIAEDPS